MGIAERREREKQQRRNGILDAAEKLFFAKGMNNATMDEVAEAAELSKGTLYLYFRNKEDLFFGIAGRALSLLLEMFEKAAKSQQTGIEKIRAIGRSYYRYSQQYSNYFNTILHYEAASAEGPRAETLMQQCHLLGQQVMQVVAGAIQAGIDDGTIRSNLDARRTAFVLQGQSSGVIQLVAREEEHIRRFENFEPAELIDDFIDLMFHALKPEVH